MGMIIDDDVEDDDPPGVPLIGYYNLVSADDLDTDTEAAGFPASNMVNAATHLKWQGGTGSGIEYVTINIDFASFDINYVGIAGHNFGSGDINCHVQYLPLSDVLLHFFGTDGATSINDDNSVQTARSWTAHGNAQIDTAQSKFGGTSLLCDGTGDYIDVPDEAEFEISNDDFTIDMWVRTASVGALRAIAGQVVAGGIANAGSAWQIVKNASNEIEASIVEGTTVTTLISTTALVVNQWYHIAFVSKDDIVRLFINGVLEDEVEDDIDVNDSNEPLTVGRAGSVTTNTWDGWIDEFRFITGEGVWEADFDVPTDDYGWNELVGEDDFQDDLPAIFRWNPVPAAWKFRLVLTLNGTPPEIAVLYLGPLLVLERSIKVDSDHVPIPYGRRTDVVSGMSETGNFLGRIVRGEYRQSKAEFTWFTPDFYRVGDGTVSLDDFLVFAQDNPFFWAWSPSEYPSETGFVWLTNDAEPAVDPVTRRIALTLDMRGIA